MKAPILIIFSALLFLGCSPKDKIAVKTDFACVDKNSLEKLGEFKTRYKTQEDELDKALTNIQARETLSTKCLEVIAGQPLSEISSDTLNGRKISVVKIGGERFYISSESIN